MPTNTSITEQQIRNQQAALFYAKRLGWRVFPVHSIHGGRCTCRDAGCSNQGKHPLISGWPQRATTDPAVIRQWWQRWPWANIGIATGEVSGFFVLDVDGDVGQTTLDGYEAKHGRLPDTVEAITGGGGRHILFEYPGFHVKTSNNMIGNTRTPKLDIKGDGGYIVAPRSLHLSRRRYEWEASSRPDEVPIAPAPEWLLNLLFTIVGEENGQRRARTAQEWRELSAGASKGHRDNTIASIAGHLLRRYVNPSLTLQLMLAWNRSHCSPPLSENEVKKTVNSVAKAELRRRKGGRDNGRRY